MSSSTLQPVSSSPSGFYNQSDHFVVEEMEPGGLVLMDGFSLLDAMSALEVHSFCSLRYLDLYLFPKIGEPRLDSGMITEENRRPPFDPLMPLLPEEVCWIIDRSFSYEVSLSEV